MNIFIAEIKDNKAVLTEEESWHCARVLRKKAGENIRLIDGKGSFYDATIEVVNDKKTTAHISAGPFQQKIRPYTLHLAIAPTKNIDRIEWMIEKAVEIGIDEISFVQCKNSERTVLKKDRILKIVESAVKQSLQAFIPKVNELKPLKNFLSDVTADQKLIAHCFESQRQNIKEISFEGKTTLVLIGPEGDFTEEEVNESKKHNFRSLSLGENRLRTETAGLYVCQAASLLS
ncbi:MAG: 16S rRNA (uracil(1498)-N(3))-methyltransferase [Bacteroidia bacterium]|nr:16S rRNA (uracil(1498)-N(3))-methyltransferase [Bacteroidia bacterium]